MMFLRLACSLAALFGVAIVAAAPVQAGDPLGQSFSQPPTAARLRVWWHWISGNVTREGITADLEAMRRVGIGGFNLFIVEQAVPRGPVVFGSPEYYDLLRHTAEEAERLGLVMEMTHSPGYSGTGGPWVPPELASQKFVWSSALSHGDIPTLPQPETVADHYRDIALLAFPAPAVAPAPVERNVLAPEPRPYPAPSAHAVVSPENVIDLSDRLRPDGSVEWTPPPGQWVLLRIGHTPTGKRTHPAPPEARGLECNKLDRAAVEHAFNHGFVPVLERLGPLAGRVLTGTLIDSYESGANDWCDDFATEFERRAGYSITPWLPVFAGYAVGGAEESQRFLWDYRKVVAELYSENYYTWMNELARGRGLTLNAEGNHSAGSTLTCNGVVDVPMMEFWRRGPGHGALANEAISAALLYGRSRIAAESFSQFPQDAWRVVPENMKPGTDQAFANGLNQLYIHRFAHQPWSHVRPGMTMGYWGMWFDRTLTWWEQSSGYNSYVARAQAVLQQSTPRVDALVWIGEGLPEDGSRLRGNPEVDKLRQMTSHRLALLNGDALRGPVSVGPNGLLLASGQRIQFLVIAPGAEFSSGSLQRLHAAVQQGLILIGEPPSASSGRGHHRSRFDQLVRELWGDGSDSRTDRSVGRGRVIRTDALASTLASLAPPVLERESGPERFAWSRREAASSDMFFVSVQNEAPSVLTLKLRVSEGRPEIWRPETGERHPAAVWERTGDYTRIAIPFQPNGSAFVVFRAPLPDSDPIVAISQEGRSAVEAAHVSPDGALELRSRSGGEFLITRSSGDASSVRVPAPPAPIALINSWEIAFPFAGGSSAKTSDLTDWSTHSDSNIRHFSGTAEYRTAFELPSSTLAAPVRAILDLGNVKNFAEVSLNGRDFPVLWQSPWLVDVTDALVPGQNELRIRVTNTWVNRLIGDEHLPEDTTWRPMKAHASDHPVFAAEVWPAWVTEGGASPHGRQTFSAMKIVHRDSPLSPSGLVGPVQLVFEATQPLTW